MTVFHPKCSKCGGNVIRDYERIYCLQCGQEWKSIRERMCFYNEHQAEIRKDVAELGKQVTTKKWQIPSNSLRYLLARWSNPKKRRTALKVTRFPSNNVPTLPPFSNDWPVELQLKWFETYQAVIISKKR